MGPIVSRSGASGSAFPSRAWERDDPAGRCSLGQVAVASRPGAPIESPSLILLFQPGQKIAFAQLLEERTVHRPFTLRRGADMDHPGNYHGSFARVVIGV